MDENIVCQKHVALLMLFLPYFIDEKVKVLRATCFTHRKVDVGGAWRLCLRPISLAKKKLHVVKGSLFAEKITLSVQKADWDWVVK